LGSITGNKTGLASGQGTGGGGLGDLLKQLTGGGTQETGGTGGGMMDIIKSLAGGAQQQQQSNGSLLDLIKGFTK
jgi:hypothetical protein